MPPKTGSAFDLYLKRDFEVDEELDLLADEEDDDICPSCGAALVEIESDVLALHCPVCDRLFR